MSYLERIHLCNNFEATDYRRLQINQKTYGYIQPSFAEQLAQWSDIFNVDDQQVVLNPALANYTTRTAAVAPILRQLYEQGVIDTWVEEAYPITHTFGGHAELEIERAATNFMGVKTFGIHVNGLVRKPDGIYVWTGTRSLDKPFWPGKLDQMVAGGQPVGLGLLENVIKEAQEEANIPAVLAQTAQAVGTISYQQQGWRGLDNSTIYVYDLWLPEDFVPENTDGEVIGFQLLPIQEVARLTETTDEFKDNCNLVNIDLLLRTGMIDAQHPDYAAIRHHLYAGTTREIA